jgi:ribosomal protein S9
MPIVEDAFELSLTASSYVPMTTTTILVSNVLLNKFFATPADCKHVVRPLKLTGVLGAFNIFAIVWDGGTTGQAGAIAHGIMQGIVTHVPEVDTILQKGEILPILCSYSSSHTLSQTMKRDPCMVERKKTGLFKAWKWVSHLFSCTTLIPHYLISVRLSIAYVPLQYQCLLCQAWKMVDSCVKIFAHNERLIMYETKIYQN